MASAEYLKSGDLVRLGGRAPVPSNAHATVPAPPMPTWSRASANPVLQDCTPIHAPCARDPGSTPALCLGGVPRTPHQVPHAHAWCCHTPAPGHPHVPCAPRPGCDMPVVPTSLHCTRCTPRLPSSRSHRTAHVTACTHLAPPVLAVLRRCAGNDVPPDAAHARRAPSPSCTASQCTIRTLRPPSWVYSGAVPSSTLSSPQRGGGTALTSVSNAALQEKGQHS